MITFKKRYYLKNLKENEIVLDIETTGLDSSVDKLVLLGIILVENNKSYLVQYFSENDLEEKRLLEIYEKLIPNKTIITYNGDTFDIPFLNNRLIKNKMLPMLPRSIDLLKIIKPYRYFFDFDSLRLIDIEKIIGFDRNDPSRYKSISKLTEEIRIRSNPYPIMKHNENDLLATELLINISDYFDDKLTIMTQFGTITLKSAFINNDILNITANTSINLGEAYFSGENYELMVKKGSLTINLQVLYGKFDKKTRGFVCLNNFDIVNNTSLDIDEHFLIIKVNRTYNYKNILTLCKKIIENHLWFSICQSISFMLFFFKNSLVLENTFDPKNPL